MTVVEPGGRGPAGAHGERYARVLVAALTVLPGPGGTVTFVHQRGGPFAGSWLLPGGGVEVGERVRDAAVREAYEETGICVRDVSLSRTYEIVGTWPDGTPFHVLMSAFVADEVHVLPPGFQADNVADVRQMTVDEAPMHSTDYRILTDAGFLAEPESSIARRLAADGLVMGTVGQR